MANGCVERWVLGGERGWGDRDVGRDGCRLRPHFVKAVVRVHAYPDGTASVFLARIGWRRSRPRETSSHPRPPRAWPRARPRQGMAWRRRRLRGGRRDGHPRPDLHALPIAKRGSGRRGFKSNKETDPEDGHHRIDHGMIEPTGRPRLPDPPTA
jgi:hypothetical protein